MSRRRSSLRHGLLLVAKRQGPTSHDVVDMARRALGERRIGHTGTLDPMAEGLLMLCVGQATRLQQFLVRWQKTYRGQIRLGHATTTYDGEGEPADPRGAVPALDRDALARLEARFAGEIEQAPPPYSAKKIGGKRMYELARSGHPAVAEPKAVTVHALSLNCLDRDLLGVQVTVSSGFYVRSLAHDVGAELGCGGYLDRLQRVSIGPYSLETAIPQSALEAAAGPQPVLDHPGWIAIDRITLPFAEVQLNRGATERFAHGQDVVVLRSGGGPLAVDSEVVVRSPGGRLLGVAVVQSVLARGRTVGLRPSMVLQPTEAPPPAPADDGPSVASGETS
ncbi:MAG TPA: tRNA pseudouridine(55) synthase TruB [Thermoanaerobaculales bacterium]|nr:tRNA pseudouridine(55) synthase TruB [Thermoanaerobaculales bacterium]HPA83093.1 tRNA pseudouridine(55) synthase TruB [Thermoanaerobaculales bacterium]HQN95552.1 tRNA pseudouridine(55) synthase TruB [Thermoanaerobaculales bacterium]HQP45122.1 tRNA pseudouridine(55) synthase TruB [Thermoanaerobaculales bacterium]